MRLLALDEVWWLVSPQNPLKSAHGMASLGTRLASARAAACHPRIRVSSLESRLGTRYAIDTVAALSHAQPHRQFIWLMGADILPELHRWHRWRAFAHALPIAVLARPGFAAAAQRAPAMAWLRRWRRPQAQRQRWTEWSPPAIIFLDIRQTPQSATAIRAKRPDWTRSFTPNPPEKART